MGLIYLEKTIRKAGDIIKSLKLNGNGDLIIEDGNLVFIDGIEETVQSIFITLSTNINEWFLNMNHGLDYSKIQGKGKDKKQIIMALEDAIYQVNDIEQAFIKDINLNRSTRNLIIQGYATDKNNNNIDLTRIGGIGID